MTSITIASAVRSIRNSASSWKRVRIQLTSEISVVGFENATEDALFLVFPSSLEGKTIRVWGQTVSCITTGTALLLKDGQQSNWGIDPVGSQLKLQLLSEAAR